MKACICDLTGEVAKGESSGQLIVDLGATRRVLISLQTRDSEKAGFVLGDIGPQAAEVIIAAVKDAAAKLAKS